MSGYIFAVVLCVLLVARAAPLRPCLLAVGAIQPDLGDQEVRIGGHGRVPCGCWWVPRARGLLSKGLSCQGGLAGGKVLTGRKVLGRGFLEGREVFAD